MKTDLVKHNKGANDRAKERSRGQILSQLGENCVTESQFDERMKLNGFKASREGKKTSGPDLNMLKAVCDCCTFSQTLTIR